MSDRFYCPQLPQAGRFQLAGDEARHLARVCRLGPGDAAQVFDGRGARYETTVATVSRDRVELRVVAGPIAQAPPHCELTLASAVPKGERFDWLVDKATELGVDRLIPLVTQRSIVIPGPAKLERLRRSIIEAAKQCGRDRLMTLDEPMRWEQLLETLGPTAARLLAHPGGTALAASHRPHRPCWRLGPKGGSRTKKSIKLARRGWTIVGLGIYRLRVETAAARRLGACSLSIGKERLVTAEPTLYAMLGLGLAAGLIGGMFGIGGGLIMVPALVLFFGFDVKTATGTSLSRAAFARGPAGRARILAARTGESGRGSLDRAGVGIWGIAGRKASRPAFAVSHEASVWGVLGRGGSVFLFRSHRSGGQKGAAARGFAAGIER